MYSIGEGELHVWHLRHRDTPLAAIPAPRLAPLSQEERRRMAAFRFDEDRRAFALAHALTRTALSACAGVAPEVWAFTTTGNGRPEISAPVGARRLRFSLSHTRDVVTCAVVLDHDVGIDVERVSCPPPMEVAPTCFSPVEISDLRAREGPDQAGRFFMYWTLKEACVKGTGEGMSAPLTAITIRVQESGAASVSYPESGGRDDPDWWLRWRRAEPDHILAAAVRARGAPLRWVEREAAGILSR